jgi:polar amino acid transport system permease protein
MMNDTLTRPAAAGTAPEEGDITAVPVRNYGTWAACAVTLVGASMLVNALVTNQRFEWGVVAEYLFAPAILTGLGRTLELTILVMLLAFALGTLLAVARLSTNPVLRATSLAYIWFFRGTPVLVQLIFWYNLSALYSSLSLGVPFGPELFKADTNVLITPFIAALVGLTLNEAAYMAEIVRAGIQSVDRGQAEAATALGLTRVQALRKVILPQAMRVVVPPTANETINLLKVTALVSVITLPELLYSAQIIYSRTFQTIPLLIVASLWYLVVTTVLTFFQYLLEKRYGRGSSHPSVRGDNPGVRVIRNVSLAFRSGRARTEEATR